LVCLIFTTIYNNKQHKMVLLQRDYYRIRARIGVIDLTTWRPTEAEANNIAAELGLDAQEVLRFMNKRMENILEYETTYGLKLPPKFNFGDDLANTFLKYNKLSRLPAPKHTAKYMPAPTDSAPIPESRKKKRIVVSSDNEEEDVMDENHMDEAPQPKNSALGKRPSPDDNESEDRRRRLTSSPELQDDPPVQSNPRPPTLQRVQPENCNGSTQHPPPNVPPLPMKPSFTQTPQDSVDSPTTRFLRIYQPHHMDEILNGAQQILDTVDLKRIVFADEFMRRVSNATGFKKRYVREFLEEEVVDFNITFKLKNPRQPNVQPTTERREYSDIPPTPPTFVTREETAMPIETTRLPVQSTVTQLIAPVPQKANSPPRTIIPPTISVLTNVPPPHNWSPSPFGSSNWREVSSTNK
jgi:hypothetical protein